MITSLVLTAEQHPNADRLRLYTVKGSDDITRTIVANLTNVYQVGDKVKTILPGEVYEGMEITERKVRGILSQGMLLGLADE